MSSENLPPDLTVSIAAPVHPAVAALRELEFRFFVEADEQQTISFALGGENGSFNVICVHDPDRDLLCLHVVHPIRALLAAVPETIRLVNHLNQPLPGGSFRVDPDDGEISFRHAVHLGDEGRLDTQAFRSALRLVRSVLDQTLPIIIQVAHAQTTAAAAFAEWRGSDAENSSN
jgi:hypothetical protein